MLGNAAVARGLDQLQQVFVKQQEQFALVQTQVDLLKQMVETLAAATDRKAAQLTHEISALTGAVGGLGVFLTSMKIAPPEMAAMVRESAEEALEEKDRPAAQLIFAALDAWAQSAAAPSRRSPPRW